MIPLIVGAIGVGILATEVVAVAATAEPVMHSDENSVVYFAKSLTN